MNPSRFSPWLAASFLGLLWGAATSVQAAAKQAPQSDGDLSPAKGAMTGHWHEVLPPGLPFAPTPPDVFAKMQPWVAAKVAKEAEAQMRGEFVPDPGTTCMPAAVPGTGSTGGLAYGFDILAERKQVTFLYQLNHNARIVYIGQDPPAHLTPRWTGYSVGHWEGDVLVVESMGFNDQNKMKIGVNLKTSSSANIPMSSKMHIVERYRLEPNGQLEDEATFDDPGAFTAPFTLTSHYKRTEPLQEYICQENNHEGGFPTSSGQTMPDTFLKTPAAGPQPGSSETYQA